MSSFILESSKFNNYTQDELLRIAEETDNHLAIHLYENVKDEVYNEETDDRIPESIENTVLHILSKPEWIKCGNQSEGVYWYLEGFCIDTHPEQHSVRIEACKNKEYMVIIEYGDTGETMHDRRIEGLAKAKEYAIDWATKYALRNELRV